jgi:putative nucleotidyltransferase with HDIG domain
MRVMFVDDDSQLLGDLQRRLKGRVGWRMRFAQGVEAALELLRKEHFDIVVSEARMRGMNGADLMACVRDVSPQTIRIILSGRADVEGVFGGPMLAVAHQILVKPLEGDALERALERAASLGDLLRSEAVRSAVANIDGLPSMPTLYTQLSAMLDDPNVAIPKLARLIESDASITARLLQVVNSAFFARGRPTSDVRDAIMYLGVEVVRSLVLSTEMFCMFERTTTSRYFSLAEFQAHALSTARIASKLSTESPAMAMFGGAAFSAGLLHDVGFMVMGAALPELYEAALRHAIEQNVAMYVAEQQVHGFTHAEVGAYLLAMWGLPESIVETVAYHHTPTKARPEFAPLVGLVHVADYVAHIGEQSQPLHAPELDASVPENDRKRYRALARKVA